MTQYVERAGLQIAEPLAKFVEALALPETGIKADVLWSGLATMLAKFGPANRALLDRRDDLQAQIDSWHKANPGAISDMAAYQRFLTDIGYLVPEPAPFQIGTENVDAEIAAMAGPQLVVPSLNDRFVLNAANARWGSLYDALYGTDVLDVPPAQAGGYDPARGAAVIQRAKEFLDQAVPLASGTWSELGDPSGGITIANPVQYVGKSETGRLFRNNGLHIEVVFDTSHPIGANDPSGIADVILESALSTIIDLEDSVAAVDADDKVLGYTNWLGLMRGDLAATFEKGGATISRTPNGDRTYTAPDGANFTLHGRSLMFVRNVGHLMTNPAVLLPMAARHPREYWTRCSRPCARFMT